LSFAAIIPLVLAVSALYALLDSVRAVGRVPVPVAATSSLDGWAQSLLAIVWLATPLLALHFAVWRRQGRPARARVAIGAAEATALALLALVVDDTVSFPFPLTPLLVVAAALFGGAVGAWAARRPRSLPWLFALAATATLVVSEILPIRSKLMLRLALDLVGIGGFAYALRAGLGAPLLERRGRALALSVGAVLASALLIVITVPTDRERWLLEQSLMHARSFLFPLEVVRGRLRPSSVGARVCSSAQRSASDDAVHASLTSGIAPLDQRSSRHSGAARDADVLLLSYDALRADEVGEFRELLVELAPAVLFQRAVSPAPRTTYSMASTLRGRPLRQVPFLAPPPNEYVPSDGPPTLATELVARGYRATYVPTHRYLDLPHRVAHGFERITTPDAELMYERDVVPAPSVFTAALGVARDTQAPLVMWMHLMESHSPYRHGAGVGPATQEGQRAAVRHLDRLTASFVRDFKRLRKRSLVVALIGDHGEEFGEHGSDHHTTTVYAEQVRVPLVLHAKGLPASAIAAPVSTAAIAATVLDLLGLSPAPSFTVPSLLGCIDRRASCPELAVSEQRAFGSWVGYTAERYRLLIETRRGIVQLFDNELDPTERHDLSRERPELLSKLRAQASAFDATYCVAADER
jgi:hypothetical protein